MANTQASDVVDVEPKERRNFVKVENGEITETEIPESGQLPDGRHVSGFDKLPDDVLAELNWVPVTDPGPPVVDSETQAVQQDLTIDTKTGAVSAVYTVVDIAPPEDPPASTQDQVDSLFALLVTKGTITQAQADAARVSKPVA